MDADLPRVSLARGFFRQKGVRKGVLVIKFKGASLGRRGWWIKKINETGQSD